jgi:transposase
MKLLSVEAKEALVEKVLKRGAGETIGMVANCYGVGESNLRRWVKAYERGEALKSGKREPKEGVSRATKLEHLLKSEGLGEEALGGYCRSQGIYAHQLAGWREELIHPPEVVERAVVRAEMMRLKQANQALARELGRKEKALAEASALLILKKKASLIWGDDEDV